MAKQGEKISFGFTKLSKQPKPTVQVSLNQDEPKQFIDYLDGNSIQIKGSDGKMKTPVANLVILPSTSSPHAKGSKMRHIIGGNRSDYLSSPDDQDAKMKTPGVNLVILPSTSSPHAKGSKMRHIIGGNRSDYLSSPDEQHETKPSSIEANDLDSIAIKELLKDAMESKLARETNSNFSLELPLPGEEANNDTESTLEDYESVPVADYGLAMLRGMGWKAAKGIGKTEKVVATVEPKVRPRGMGLGVSMEGMKKPTVGAANPKKPEEELKIIKGAYVQVTSGSKKGFYGQIEGFNEESGRLILKMALGGSSLSVSEYMVNPVTKDEFTQNSRVLNSSKYKEYKDKESEQKENGSSKSSHRYKDDKKEVSRRPSRRDRSRSPRRH